MIRLMIGIIQLISVAALASASAEGRAGETQNIKVRAYTRVFDAQKITLLDLVETANISPALQEQFKAIQLGDTPRVGEQRTYASQVIAQAIREQARSKMWTVQIPRQIVVENKGFELDQQSIEKQLMSEWTNLCADCEISIENLQLPVVPEKMMSMPWQMEKGTQMPRGSFSKKVTIMSESGRSHIFWVNGKMNLKKKVPVLKRSVQINSRLGQDDFEWAWRDVTFATDSTPSEKEIIGQKAKFSMNASDVIWRNSLLQDKAVQRGEVVKVYMGEDNWQVSVSAVLEQDGYVGDTVNMRNTQTQKLLTGRVVGQGEVEIK